MPLLAIPNISTAGPSEELTGAVGAVERAGARVLDVHSDTVHNRSVLTVTAAPDELGRSMVALAIACKPIDLRDHRGVHPRVGALDVCPFVPHETPLEDAVALAHSVGPTIAHDTGAPVFFYGAAALRAENEELPDIRRGGLDELTRRLEEGFAPDAGAARIDPAYGAVLVGARGPLIAFNVWLETSPAIAKTIAANVREPHRLRALGLPIDQTRCQVSMNLIAPEVVGVDEAFERVEREAANNGAWILGTELVGLVAERLLPKPDAKAARLLIEPGRSLESALGD